MFNFKALLSAWRGGGLISDMYEEFADMLDKASRTFDTAWKALRGEVEPESLAEEVSSRDKEINRTERLIRRQVVEHLSFQQGADVTLCLILMSIVKDAERLGDYARDLFWVSYISPRVALAEPFAGEVERLHSEITRLIFDSRKALADSDEELARDVMKREDRIKKDCDRLIDNLAASGLPSDRTVALTLVSRYLNRITAHTANVSSGVVNPVERLDFRPEEKRN